MKRGAANPGAIGLRLLWAGLPLALSACAQLPGAPAKAGTEVELQAQARREIANDVLQATVYAEISGADPGRIASEVNARIAGAMALARQMPSVQARSGSMQTFPVYDRSQHQTGWRAR